jgi:hypothetical protein
MKSWLPLAALALAFVSPSAHALKLSVVGAGNYSNADNQSTTGYGAKASIGGGGLLELSLIPTIGLEIGALFVPRQYAISGGSYDYSTKQNFLQVPVMLRANLMNVISLGVGGYVGRYMGEPEYTVNSGVTPTRLGYGPGALSQTDYGTMASLAFYTPLTPLARFVFDARYVISAKNADQSANDRKFRDIQLLVGVQMGL